MLGKRLMFSFSFRGCFFLGVWFQLGADPVPCKLDLKKVIHPVFVHFSPSTLLPSGRKSAVGRASWLCCVPRPLGTAGCHVHACLPAMPVGMARWCSWVMPSLRSSSREGGVVHLYTKSAIYIIFALMSEGNISVASKYSSTALGPRITW